MFAIALAVAVALSGAPKAAPPKKTQLKVQVKPDTAVLFVDGQRKGTGAKVHTLTVEPGRHMLKVVNKGDEHQEMVSIKKGETKNWEWAFEDDRADKKKSAESAETPSEEAPASE